MRAGTFLNPRKNAMRPALSARLATLACVGLLAACTSMYGHAAPAMASGDILVGDADGGLEGVEGAGLDGELGGGAVAGVADEAGFAGVAGFLDGGDDVALAELGFGAGVELEEVEAVGFEALEGAVDLLGEHAGVPVGEVEAFAVVAALGEEEEVAAAVADGVADEGRKM